MGLGQCENEKLQVSSYHVCFMYPGGLYHLSADKKFLAKKTMLTKLSV